MMPNPHGASTMARHLGLALAMTIVACGCAPATAAALWAAPSTDTAAPGVFEKEDSPLADHGESIEPDGPVPQTPEAQAAAYKENEDAARRYQAAYAAAVSHRYGRTQRGFHTLDIPVVPVAIMVIAGIVLLRLMFALRKPALAPSPAAAHRQIVSLACNRCDRVLDVPRDRAGRRLFCPRCGAVISIVA